MPPLIRPMNYDLLALDLDGTLFDSDGRIPEANRLAVRRAREAGALVVLCTGRGLCEVRYAIDTLGHEGPVILSGGALVADPITGKTLHRALIEPQLAAELTDRLRREKQAALLLLDPDPQQHDYIVVGPEDLNDNTRWWFDTIKADVKYTHSVTAEDLHHVLRVGIVAPQSLMPGIQAGLVARYGEQIVVHHFLGVKRPDEDVHVLEIFAAGVNKWSGLSWLAEEHHISLSRVAAIGDHINDVAMIQSAACGIAMGNAIDTVKRLAKRHTLTNDQCGVAHAIDQLLSGVW